MKLQMLRLVAYGPFTDAVIDFSSAANDFHLVFGPNEAGKSTALRALRHLFFGIPVQTADNFLHPYPNLRVGARLVGSDGRRIDFLRRKGKAKTLRTADDESVLEDNDLVPFLGGVDQTVFEQMFAIGHEDLVRGGEEIVSGKGRIGEALFAAGAGLIRLQTVQQGLEQDCGVLFKPSGSTPRINQALAALKAVRKTQKEALLQEKTWQTHDQALRNATAQMANVQETLQLAKQRVTMLQRILDALPFIARRKEIAAALEAFEGIPDLPDDFGEKRRDAEKDLKIAYREMERAGASIEKITGRIATLTVPEALLQQAAAVEALQHELGSFRKAHQDRPGLQGRMRTLQQQAAERLAQIDQDISVESVEGLKLPPSTIGEIHDLGNAFERLTVRLDDAKTQCQKLENRLNHLADERASLPAPVDVTSLEAAFQAAMEAGPVEQRVAEQRAAAEFLENELVCGLKRQTLWNGAPEGIEAMACPTAETIDRFEAHLDDAARRIETLRERRAATEEEIARIRIELQAIDRIHRVPTESDLIEARSLRDRGWGLIRQRLAGKAVSPADADAFIGPIDGASGLPDAFEGSMHRADRIADRLRHEAQQVSQKGLLAARQKQFQDGLAKIGDEITQAITDYGALTAQWQALWQPAAIIPLSPKEMRAWLSAIEALRAKLAELRKIKAQVQIAADQQEALESGLRRALAAVGAPPVPGGTRLPELIHRARAHAAAQRDHQTRIASMDKDLSNLAKERQAAAAAVADLEKALVAWQKRWHQQVARIGIDAGVSPTAAMAVIDSLKEARAQMMDADVLRKRIEGIDRDAAAFNARVGEKVEALAPDLAAEPRDRAAELLYARLTTARKIDAERRGLQEQLTAANQEKADAEKRISRCTAAIEALCAEAGCAGADDLAEMEKRAHTRKVLLCEREDLEKRLRGLSAGATVDAFVAGAALLKADRIGPESEALEEEIKRLEAQRSALDQTIGTEKAELKRMDGGAEAAGHAATAEGLLAGLEADVAHYARLKIASVILARTVEQYREKHQGPLIARASALFAAMTCGAFDRLRAEYDEKGNPVMVGIRRPQGTSVTVDGMSDGTADQLYLALRLASLEQYLDANEPLPFVVDDILLRFDDQRSLATLEVLSGLAAKTQVIFFTHHRHLVELAAAHLGADRMVQHRL